MTILAAFAALVVVGTIAVALFARFTYLLVVGDRRVDANAIDWRNMARHRARFEANERARIAASSSTAELRSRWP